MSKFILSISYLVLSCLCVCEGHGNAFVTKFIVIRIIKKT